ncbi:Ig-like domain-containing protein [bacterium]|nr:Ig-like domain-containing protein [bacterium]
MTWRDIRRIRCEGPGRTIGSALAGCLVLAACAVVEPPPGGPEDLTPPTVLGTRPDSAATGVGPIDVLTVKFSEKMNRVSATGWLFLYPPRTYTKTKWHGATTAEVFLAEPLPADTVVVVEIAGGMKDAHKVANRTSRRFAFSTGGDVPRGRIEGSLILADSALSGAVVELYPLPPDTLEYFQQPLLRRTVSGEDGRFDFSWLPTPGGPYLLRAFADGDGNLRLGENEPRRLLPDTLHLAAPGDVAVAGLTELFPLDAPGQLLLSAFPRALPGDRLVGFALAVAAEDTGWTPAPAPFDSTSFRFFGAAGGDTIPGIPSGKVRLIAFLDADGDSSLGAVPGDLIPGFGDPAFYVLGDSLGDTLGSYLEPLLVVGPLPVEPGLPTALVWPDTALVIWPWASPVDSLAAAGVDSLAPGIAEPDSAAVQEAPDEP